MKQNIPMSAAIPAAFVAATARIFLDLALDGGSIHNGAWISALLSALPAIPYLLCLYAIRAKQVTLTPIYLMLSVSAVLDAAHVISILIRASGYLTLDHVPNVYLALPLALALLWCVWRGGEAIGYAAMLWIRLFPALMLLVLLLQIGHYNARWLLPLLGNGWQEITRGSVRAAGWFAPATAVILVADSRSEDNGKPRSIAHIAAAALIAALLLALRLMMAPTGMQGLTWIARLDALLTNGRAPLYLQLPMILVFFVGNLHLLACECFAASMLLQRLTPPVNGHICAALVLTICTGLSLSGITIRVVEDVAPWLYIAAASSVAITAIFQYIPRGGAHLCEG